MEKIESIHVMKLQLNLIPSSCFYTNVRSILTKQQWDIVKSQVYAKAYYICEICQGVGPKHPVEAHEVFSFDNKTLIQKLEKMIALCPSCHQCAHFGLAELQGKRKQALSHLMKINKISNKQAEKYIKDCFMEWALRSKYSWKLDVSHLSEYGINIKL